MSKQSIILAIIIVIIVVLVSGYIIYQRLDKEEIVQEDEISSIFSSLKKYTGIGFLDAEDMELSWMIEKEGKIKEMITNSKKIEAERVTDLNIIENYFKDNGFEEDIYNIVSGAVFDLIGYKKDNIICIVVEKIQPDSFSSEEDVEKNVSIKCGYFDKLSEGLSNGEVVSGENKNVKKDEEFLISLEANLTTGYQWNVDFDNYYIELIDVSYNSGSSELVGSTATEVFKFKALQEGEVDLSFSYLRPWEEKAPIKRASYRIIIEK